MSAPHTRRPRGHNIDAEFVEAMRSIGGKPPLEINPACSNSDNADVVLPEDNILIEVKTLVEDSRDSKTFRTSIEKLYRKWVHQKKVPYPIDGKITINTATLPRECAHEFLRQITKRAKRDLEKANKQIKGLKKSLGMPDAKGLFVLCNTGNAFLPPDAVLYGLHHAMKHEYSSIDWLIFMTHKLPLQIPGHAGPREVFMQATREGREKMPSSIFERIKGAWMESMCPGMPILDLPSGDASILFDAKHFPLDD